MPKRGRGRRKGFKHSPKTRKKIKKAMKGNKNAKGKRRKR